MSNDDILKGLGANGHTVNDTLKDSLHKTTLGEIKKNMPSLQDYRLKHAVERLNENRPSLQDQLKELAPQNYERAYMPEIKTPDFSSALEGIQKKNQEREEREKIRTDNSIKSVELQEEHIRLQKETIDILRTRIDAANHTLDLLLNSLGANAQKTQQELIENRKQLIKLNALIETDENGNAVKEFIAEHGIESISLIAQLIGMILSK